MKTFHYARPTAQSMRKDVETYAWRNARVRFELQKAGVGRYGLLKAESRYLPFILQDDEHIGGVVYGLSEVGSVMLIATDKRVIYLDRKMLFTVLDEFPYDVITGLRISMQGPFSNLTLHTRNKDYILRYVRLNCARIFEYYLETKRIEVIQRYASTTAV